MYNVLMLDVLYLSQGQRYYTQPLLFPLNNDFLITHTTENSNLIIVMFTSNLLSIRYFSLVLSLAVYLVLTWGFILNTFL